MLIPEHVNVALFVLSLKANIICFSFPTSKLPTHWEENQRNNSEYEEMPKVKKIRQTEEVAPHKEQDLQTRKDILMES